MGTSRFLRVILATLAITHATPQSIAANERQASDAGPLAFRATGTGDLSFNTGVVKGALTKDGLGEALKTITYLEGNVAIDQNHGLLCPYRFLTPQRRYGFGSWEWPRTGKVLSNGAAQLLWGSAPDRPFAFSTVYRWQSADTLDFTVFFAPQTNLDKFELFLGSYFNNFAVGKAYVRDARDGMPGLREATSNKGELQLFPGSQQLLPMINDGRWRFPPNPMNMAIQIPLAGPLGMRTQPGTGVTVIFMSPPEDCFAISMWTRGWSQCGCYLSLFGKGVKQGETLMAHARLVFGKNITDAQALDKYAAYLKDMQNNRDDALLTRAETAAMRQVFAASPSEANAVKPPAWLSSEVPKPDADGWIRLFDGKHLSGCTPSVADLEARKITLQDGSLRLDSCGLTFNVTGSNVVLRARLKKVSGQNCDLSVRDGDGRSCMAWFNGGDFFGIGKVAGRRYQNLATIHAGEKHSDFMVMELRAEGEHLTLNVDGKNICNADDDSVSAGAVGVGALKGMTAFNSIEVRNLAH